MCSQDLFWRVAYSREIGLEVVANAMQGDVADVARLAGLLATHGEGRNGQPLETLATRPRSIHQAAFGHPDPFVLPRNDAQIKVRNRGPTCCKMQAVSRRGEERQLFPALCDPMEVHQ